MTASLGLTYTARLDLTPVPRDLDRSWCITFGFGKPAGGMFTEVAMPDFTDDWTPLAREVQAEVVRRVAIDLYGTAWAFHYGPEQYDGSIAQYGMTLREHVTVTSVEVWS